MFDPKSPQRIVIAMMIVGAAAGASTGAASEIPDRDFLATYAETFRLSLGHPTAITPSDDGKRVFFLRSPARSQVRDLFVFDIASGEERKLADASTLLGGGTETLTAEERARRERQRLVARGIARFHLIDGGRRLLIPLSGRLYVLDTESGEVSQVATPAGAPIDPRPSPTGSHVGYVVGGDFHVVEIATGEESRLTKRESPRVTWGLAEFVAQEEMDRDHGYWFSPDSEWVVVQRTDTSAVERIHIADAMHPMRTPSDSAYPRPGETNADVRLAVLPTSNPTSGHAAPVWIDWNRERYPYLTTVVWPTSGPLTIVVQNRLQTELAVLAVDPRSGATRTLLVERDDAWLELDQDVPRWLDQERGFLWTTEREGARQLELRRPDGALDRALTATDFGYRDLVGVDADHDRLVVSASADPTRNRLWNVPLTGGGEPEPLTPATGEHSGKLAKSGELLAITSRHPETGRVTTLRDRRNRDRGRLASHAVTLDYRPNTEFVTVGERDIRAVVVRPRDFDAKRRYPVIVHIYAGPTSRMVRQTRDRYYLPQWFADHGFIVVSMDGRGTPGRGRAWHRAVKGDLITLPIADQADALTALGARFPEMDLDRAGIFGWSFGGYASAMAVMMRGDLFKAAVAGAPVTDWQDYDTHYTERYLGLPQETPETYAVSNVLTYAEKLERPLMIVHGTADDNVLFVHALKMSDALLRAGKSFELVPLAGLTHMLTEANLVERLYSRMIDFFRRHLGTPQDGTAQGGPPSDATPRRD